MRSLRPAEPDDRPSVFVVGDTAWFRDNGEELLATDLDGDDCAELWGAVEADDYVGKTVAAVLSDYFPGAFGAEPCTRLVFTDGSAVTFVHPIA